MAGERGRSQLEEVSSAHKHILHFFDYNQDGTISFNEFVLIVIALSVPEKDVDIVFDIIDLDNNGVLSEEEFQQVRCMRNPLVSSQRWCTGTRCFQGLIILQQTLAAVCYIGA